MDTKKVFISYSRKIIEQVIELANRLISDGVDVVIDEYDLKDGQDKYVFMEQCVTDDSINRVLMICDESYCKKANNRDGGVGDEIVIISPEVYGKSKQEKFIPIVVERDENGKEYLPQFIKSRIYIDLTYGDPAYEENYEKLLRNIYEKPLHRKPALGQPPEWLEDESTDLSSIRSLIKQLKNDNNSNPKKTNFVIKKTQDEIINSIKSYSIPKTNDGQDKVFLKVLSQTKDIRDLYIDYLELLNTFAIDTSNILTSFFESLFNELNSNSMTINLGEYLYNYLITEFFIDTIAVLLYYEKYTEIYNLVMHTYFLKTHANSDSVVAANYFSFRIYNYYIEESCKPNCHNPNLFTLTGEILVNRAKKPILTKESISNADLVLFQLGELLVDCNESPHYWFPTSYVYHSGTQAMWQKLISKEYCEHIKPLFGADNISELKEIISNTYTDSGMRYGHGSRIAPTILSSISIDDIATMR